MKLGQFLATRPDIVGVAAYDGYLPDTGNGCGDREGYSYDSGYGGLGVTVPPFDPTLAAEVAVLSNLTVTYAIAGTN